MTDKPLEPTQTTELAEVPAPDPITQLIAAAQSGADAGALERVADVMLKIRAEEARVAYHNAMREVQARLMVVAADARNPQTNSNYTRYETLHRKLAPIYTVHGFTLSFTEEPSDSPDLVRVAVKIMHSGGHTEERRLQGAIDDRGIKGNVNKTPIHGRISAVSYLRRQLEGMVFNVVAGGEDDDGNAAGGDVAETITPEQAADLQALCADVGADEARFLKWMRVESWEDIPESWHDRAVKGLEAKRAKA